MFRQRDNVYFNCATMYNSTAEPKKNKKKQNMKY